VGWTSEFLVIDIANSNFSKAFIVTIYYYHRGPANAAGDLGQPATETDRSD